MAISLMLVGCGGGSASYTSQEDPVVPPVVVEPILDTTPPVITILGNNPDTVVQSDTYTDAGATAIDDVDGEVPVTATKIAVPTRVGTWTIVYTATDNAGNTATASRTVIIVEDNATEPEPDPDTTPPVITVLGNNPDGIYLNGNYIDAGATATDDVDGSVPVSVSGSFDPTTLGAYTVYYNAVDNAGNHAETKTRIVYVIEPPVEPDTTAPVITVLGNNPETVIQDDTYNDAGATAIDDVDGDVPVVVSGSVDTSTLGIYTISYNSVDSSGNHADTKTRSVEVVEVPVAPQRPLKMVWRVSDADLSIFYVIRSGYEYNCTIDWGDGVTTIVDTVEAQGTIIQADHSYQSAGDYTVTIDGKFPSILLHKLNSNNPTKLLDVSQWGDMEYENFDIAFYNATSLESFSATDVPNLTKCKSLMGTFAYATKFNGDITGWDTATIEDMSGLFYEASAYDQDVSNLNTSNVVFMGAMFYRATSFTGKGIENLDVSLVQDMNSMFYGASSFNGDIGNWETDSLAIMYQIFYGANSFNQDLYWNTSAVTDLGGAFQWTTSFDGDLSSLDVSNVQSMQTTFQGSSFTGKGIENWNTDSLENLNGTFMYCSSFNKDLNWNFSNVTNFADAFAYSSYDGDVGGWDMASAEDLNGMFYNASSFTGKGVSNWDISNVTMMYSFLTGATLDQNNYDNMWLSWANLPLQSDVYFDASNQHSSHVSSTIADIEANYNWTISDGGEL